jgi:hypothetical protein
MGWMQAGMPEGQEPLAMAWAIVETCLQPRHALELDRAPDTPRSLLEQRLPPDRDP